MRNDPIVEEVRRLREAYAAQFDFDLDALVEDLERKQAETGLATVSLKSRKPASGRSSAA
jgi:hypothetical protein